jgi:hypothetical protein
MGKRQGLVKKKKSWGRVELWMCACVCGAGVLEMKLKKKPGPSV